VIFIVSEIPNISSSCSRLMSIQEKFISCQTLGSIELLFVNCDIFNIKARESQNMNLEN
jgi:hypothetical protein